jgi:hypothetical protein
MLSLENKTRQYIVNVNGRTESLNERLRQHMSEARDSQMAIITELVER